MKYIIEIKDEPIQLPGYNERIWQMQGTDRVTFTEEEMRLLRPYSEPVRIEEPRKEKRWRGLLGR
ncbi:MAG: hypothetical protein IKG59_01830 [Firmicutes bacterium]|nr:hypothetical protein [Bacillota bacterium]